MRIYEFAQQKNLSSKTIVEKLQQNGFDVKSHMSLLDDQALAFIESEFNVPHNEKKNAKKDLTSQQIGMSQPIEKEEPATVEKKHEPAPKINTTHTFQEKHTQKNVTAEVVVEPLVLAQMSVSSFAEKIKKPVTDVIVTLLKWGIVTTKNQILADSVVKRLAEHYEIPIAKTAVKKEVVEKEKKINVSG